MRKSIVKGDRVRVFGYCTMGKDVDGEAGSVLELRENGVVHVGLSSANHCVKISQCRKLVKRQPKFYWIGKVRHSDDKFLWVPLVAHPSEPTAKTADGEPWIKARVVKP